MENAKSGYGAINSNEDKPTTIVPSINVDSANVQHYGAIPQQKPSETAEEKQSKCMLCLGRLSTMTIEPAMFCFMFGYVLSKSCMTNMIMDKGCLYKLNYSSEICSNLSYYKEEKDIVEKLGSDYNLYMSLLTPIGALMMIFIAPWSDKYGRKPPFIMALLGSMTTDIGITLCALNFESKLQYLILASLPFELFGGFICVLTIVFSHASEVSSSKRRTLKYMTVELAFGTALALGSLAGGLLYRNYGYVHVYATSLVFHAMAVPWVIFMVPETSGLDSDATWKKKFLDFFSFSSVKEGLRVCLRVRPNKGRAQLWMLFLSVCFMIITYEAFANIGFLYAHHQFDWDAGIYNQVSTIFSLLQMAVLVVLVPLLIRVFKVGDPMLGMMGVMSMFLKNILIGFAKNKEYLWIFYLGNVTGFLSGVAPLAIRARISKIVDEFELGRVFAFLAICEAIVPMFGTILLTRIFNATLDIYPSVCYLTAAAMLVLPFGTYMWQHQLTKTLLCQTITSAASAEVKA